ncbi:histidine kinase N-terminal 7TM domain-containing protein [Oceanobacillus kapialis]|uniref:histidine kinase N-terminal 7TM domain-containing diguanylate cyclase n=1 Tax=Oceanobacillus kapialis TaxID=481353 RepID=UPI00384EC6E9
MNSALTAYITLICTSGVFNMYLCFRVFARRRRYTGVATYFVLYTIVITIYCFTAAFSLMATNLEEIKFWTIMQYTAMPLSSPLGLLFTMRYLGMKMKRKTWIFLLIIPVISLFMVATNDLHHLHYRVFEIDPSLGTPFIHIEIGLWYIIHGVFTFTCMFIAFLLVVYRWKETTKKYRPQLLALLIGQLVPMLTAFLYLIGTTPPGVDPVPMVLWITSILYLWSISSSSLLAITPIAKNTIFNSINDGVMVLDESFRLIEFNHAAKLLFPGLKSSMYGMKAKEVWLALTEAPLPAALETAHYTGEVELDEQMNRVYQIRTASLQAELNSKREGLLWIFTDVTEVKKLQVQLEHQAYYDELTQVLNRRAFFERSEQEYRKAKELGSAYTVIIMDVDYFKRVNDTYGHYVGDQLLKHVAQFYQKRLKDMLFARYGGEEFVVGLKGMTAGEGEAIAEELRQAISREPLATNEAVISITLSSGVAEAKYEAGETLQDLLNRADKALYEAKQNGRNRVNVYETV